MSLYGFIGGSAPYQGSVGLYPRGLPNPGLQWEETRKLQLGIDFGFLQDKLVLNANWVRNRSSNQLTGYALPSPAGRSSYLLNFPAVIQNKNWEVVVAGKIVQKRNLGWTSSINLTVPKNRLLEFPGLPDSSTRWKIGQPTDAVPVYHWLGVGAGTGEYLYADQNGHPTTAPGTTDMNVWVSRLPKFYAGFQNTITHKSLQLDFIIQAVKQNGYNDLLFSNGTFTIFPGMFSAGHSNQPTTLLDRWQKPDDKASVAKYSNYVLSYILASDRRFSDMSFISLRNVSLSWDLPEAWMTKGHFRSFRVYIHAQNLLTLSKYKGLNPETQSMAILPPLQVWTVGVQIEL
jgi:hypothetical protein